MVSSRASGENDLSTDAEHQAELVFVVSALQCISHLLRAPHRGVCLANFVSANHRLRHTNSIATLRHSRYLQRFPARDLQTDIRFQRVPDTLSAIDNTGQPCLRVFPDDNLLKDTLVPDVQSPPSLTGR
ncbi:Uncharacterised protein [Enterobacter kobei]|nr:Uncharacterised protein [Enterobacter kobei]